MSSRHLMARFRHLHTADKHGLDFDWKPQRNPHWSDPSSVKYHAKLENGDSLIVDDGTICGQHMNNVKNNHSRWGYHLLGPTRPTQELDAEGIESYWSVPWIHQDGEASEVLAQGGHGPSPSHRGEPRLSFINDPDGAMGSAEGHYKSLNRTGITPPAHEYDINEIMRQQGM